MDALRISATANGQNYLPEYVADAAGLFEKAGLTVVARAKDPWTGVLDDLVSGEADLALGGIWVPGMLYGAEPRLTVVCQLNHQFPMAIVLREDIPAFDLAQLRGMTILAPGAGGSAPYAFTAGLIREQGIDPRDVTFIRDLSTRMLLDMYRAGTGDGIILDLTSAAQLQAAGGGTIVFRHLEAGGIMPNSVYYCLADRVDELADRISRFSACIAEAMTRMSADDPVVRAVLAERWPDADQELLRSVQAELAASQVWASAAFDPAAVGRWMGILADEKMVPTAPAFEDLVDTRFTRDLVAARA
ncbi:ABC transporter substrate-binding protein [Microbacterium sp. ASV81]|uniref:ABC transporter substrate-binding protein n=1 Tax=Microbacterium capsulatum TaxID=3041921 RepID=A0ABU0XGQ7_9MICO|nr:ABC transporter substrate-binding protein [Microbacterium sp. ASV81]MDQ4214313.1 ABC transporter substrate-binding protein [Microbacterium sp. ASV81]